MSQLDFFMTPDSFFALVCPVVSRYDASIVFRRSQPDENVTPRDFPAGYEIVDVDSPLAEQYRAGRFSIVYFSLGALPSHAQDWDFFEDNYEQLLECRGGRLDDDSLEMLQLRVVAKKSKAQKLFNAIKRKLASEMDRGELTTTGHAYPNIYYSESALRFTLWEDIVSKKWEYFIKDHRQPTPHAR